MTDKPATNASARRDQLYLAVSALMFAAVACWWAWGRTAANTDPIYSNTLAHDHQTRHPTADIDGDGIADLADRCPTLAGIAATGGCPADDDADGIANIEDRCPEVAGTAALLGCPNDSDGDTISDDLDHCPGLAGEAHDNGCPADSDGDGVFDIDDNCPQQAGDDGYGCAAEATTEPAVEATLDTSCNTLPCDDLKADADTDGIPDHRDLCPAHPGPQSSGGCPADADADGVADALDQCPEAKGPSNGNGCPVEQDSDMDGLADGSDACPTVAGIVARHGCPADRDGDSVADGEDLCPNTAGAINLRGCPPSPEDMMSEPQAQTGQITEIPASVAAALPTAPAKIDDSAPLVDTRLGKVKTYPALQPAADSPISDSDRAVLDSAIAMLEFEPDSATLTGNSANALMNVANLLKRYPDAILEISGHTDSSGDAVANMELSKERARACALFFVQHGVPLKRLKAAGFGESRPIASNDTIEGRRLNRRVEFNLTFAG